MAIETRAGTSTGPGARLPAAAPGPAGDGDHVRRRARPDPVALVAAALVLVPTIAALASALRHEWVPTNDWALLELAVRDVGTADTPLLGAWSRFGWRHPGPLPFYLLAIPYRLAPSGAALLAAAATVNLLAVAACAALALRHPRCRALVLLAGLAALQLGLGVDQLADPWNPTLPILPFTLYVLLCLELVVAPRRWIIPAAAAVASFVVQAHVGFAQPVLLVGVVAVALWARERPGRARLRSWRRMVPTGVVLAVAWLPVAIDQVAGTGNVGMLVRWSLGREVSPGMGELTEGRLPLDRVAGSAAWLLAPIGSWLGRADPVEMFGYQLLGTSTPFLLAWVPLALAGAIVLARRTGRAEDRRAVTAAAVLAATGAVATVTDLATAEGSPVHWPFRWVGVVVMLIWVTVGWAAAAALVRRYPALDRPVTLRPLRVAPLAGAVAGVGLVALPVAVALWAGTLGRQPEQAESDALLRLVPAIEREARRRPLVVANSTVLINPVDLGLPVVLERAGIPWVEHDDPRAAGHWLFTLASADVLDGFMAVLVEDGHAEVLARSGPPRPGEARDSEVVLIAYDPDADLTGLTDAEGP